MTDDILRRIDQLERDRVTKEVYERDMREMRADISDIKKGTNRLIALVITESVGLLVAIVLLLLNAILDGGAPL